MYVCTGKQRLWGLDEEWQKECISSDVYFAAQANSQFYDQAYKG